MPLAWKKNWRDLPSEYVLDINGRPLKCFLCRMEEAQNTATYNYIRTKFATEVHAVGVAKGDKQEGECRETKYPDYVKVIRALGTCTGDAILLLCTVGNGDQH